LLRGKGKTRRDLTKIVGRARAGDEAAINTLVELYAARLYGLLYRLTGSRTDAEDLLQETYIKMLRGLQSYTENGRFEPWLFSIAANLARDWRRKQARRQDGAVSLDSASEPARAVCTVLPSSDPAPEALAEKAEQIDRLQAALSQLSEGEREVILLRFFSGLGFREIAEVLEIPLGTALARAHRGLKHLREILQVPGEASPRQRKKADAGPPGDAEVIE